MHAEAVTANSHVMYDLFFDVKKPAEGGFLSI